MRQQAGGLLHVYRALSQPEEHALAGRDYEFAGRLGIEQVKATLALDDYDFYLCGPGSFTQDLYEGLRGLHVPDARIHAEAFGPSTLRRHTDDDQPTLQQPPAASEPVPVYFAASARTRAGRLVAGRCWSWPRLADCRRSSVAEVGRVVPARHGWSVAGCITRIRRRKCRKVGLR